MKIDKDKNEIHVSQSTIIFCGEGKTFWLGKNHIKTLEKVIRMHKRMIKNGSDKLKTIEVMNVSGETLTANNGE